MARFAWLTPDAAAGAYTCRRLSIPDELVHVVTGALDHLIVVGNWETLGTMTPDEAVSLCEVMIDDYLVSNGACMIGSVHPFIGVLPAGVLPCDGSQYLRVDYPDLYAMLDAFYIVDADNFVTPDLRGRSVIGSGSGVGLTTRTIGDSGGSEDHQLTVPEMPSHRHPSHQHDPNIDVEPPVGVPDVGAGVGLPAQTGVRGNDQPHNNMQPFHSIAYGLVAR